MIGLAERRLRVINGIDTMMTAVADFGEKKGAVGMPVKIPQAKDKHSIRKKNIASLNNSCLNLTIPDSA